MSRRRMKPAVVEREVVAAMHFYMQRGWSWAVVVAYLSSKALWTEVR